MTCLSRHFHNIGKATVVVDKASPRGSGNKTHQQRRLSIDRAHEFRQYAIKINRKIRGSKRPDKKISVGQDQDTQTDGVTDSHNPDIVEKQAAPNTRTSSEMGTQTDKIKVERVSREIGTQSDKMMAFDKETTTDKIFAATTGTATEKISCQ